jgi:hypothetical protein
MGVCKEKEMRDWRNELRAALPGRTWEEIRKRLRYLGLILQKRRIVKSEGDEVGLRLRVYVSRYAHLPEGSEDEVDMAEAIAHLEAYQRAAEGFTASDCRSSVPADGVPADLDLGAPPPEGDSIEGTHSVSSNQPSIAASSEEAPESVARSEAARGFGVVAGRPWMPDEDAAIRAGVEAGKLWREISDGLPGRTVVATQRRGSRLGLKQREAGVPWTADEDAMLRAGVEAGESWKSIAGKLPRRTGEMARHRAGQLRIERREKRVVVAWTAAEDEEVRAGVAAGETTAKIAGRLPGRTLVAVEIRRAALKEGERRVLERWTEREDAALREGFASGKSWKEIAKAFPARTENAVRARGIGGLGLKRREPRIAIPMARPEEAGE